MQNENVSVTGTAVADTLILGNFPPHRLSICADQVSSALSGIYTRYRMTTPEWRVLVVLFQFGKMAVPDICTVSHMHKTKVWRALTALERRGWVQRNIDLSDRRQMLAVLLPAGTHVCTDLVPVAHRLTLDLWDVLDAEEQAILHRALQKLADRARQMAAGAD